jgi:hypothetical protein
VIFKVDPVSMPVLLPDHHNEFGKAYWTEAVPVDRIKCVLSVEGSWEKSENDL